MRYFSGMIAQMLTRNGFIEDEERAEIKAELDESFKGAENSENPIAQKINQFFKHPIGVLVSLYAFVKVSALVRKQSMIDNDESLEAQFEQEYKARLMQKMLDKE